jgi:hypothetical protein
VLGIVTWAGLELSGKAKDDPVAPAVHSRERARALRQVLDRPVTVEFEAGPLKDCLEYFQDRYQITITVDEAAFKDSGQEDIKGALVKLDKTVGVNLRTALRTLLAQGDAGFLEQDGRVVVIPKARLTAASLFQQSIDAIFEKAPLADALQELAALSGVSVVLDPGAAEQARTPITATLSHASLGASVRVLANMAGLKPVAIDKVLYITTSAKAAELSEEQTPKERPMAPADQAEPKKQEK